MVKNIRQIAGTYVPFLLIGNTATLTEIMKPVIESNEVKEFANKEGGIYVEFSPEMTEMIDNAISELTRRMIDTNVLEAYEKAEISEKVKLKTTSNIRMVLCFSLFCILLVLLPLIISLWNVYF